MGDKWLHKELAFLIFESALMLLNVVMFNILHPGQILPCDSRVFFNSVGEEKVSEYGPLNDTRPLPQKICDPLDINGLLKAREVKDH